MHPESIEDRAASTASVLKSVENVDGVHELAAVAGGKPEHGPPAPFPAAPEAIEISKKRGRPRTSLHDYDENGLGPTERAPKKREPNTAQPATDDVQPNAEGCEDQRSPVDIFLRSLKDLGYASAADPRWAAFGLRFKVNDYRPSHGGTFAEPDTGARLRPLAFVESAEELANRELKARFWAAEARYSANPNQPPDSESATAPIDALLQSATGSGAPLVLAIPLSKDYGKANLTGISPASSDPDAQLLRQLHASRGGYTIALAHLTCAHYSFDPSRHDAWRHPGVGAGRYKDGVRAKVAVARHVRTVRGERVFCADDAEVEMVLTEQNLLREAPGRASRTRKLARPTPPARKRGGGMKQLGPGEGELNRVIGEQEDADDKFAEGEGQADQATELKKDDAPGQAEKQDVPMEGQDGTDASYKEGAVQVIQDAHDEALTVRAEEAEQPLNNEQAKPEPEPEDAEYQDDDDDEYESLTRPKRKKAGGRKKKTSPATRKEDEFPESRCLEGLRARYVNEQEWRRTAILLWKPADHGSVILAHMGTGAIMRNIDAHLRAGTQLELPEMAVSEALAVLRAPAHLWRKVRARDGRKALLEAMLVWARAAKKPEVQAEIELLWTQYQADEVQGKKDRELKKKEKEKLSSWIRWNGSESEDGSCDDVSEESEEDVVAAMMEEEKDWPLYGPEDM